VFGLQHVTATADMGVGDVVVIADRHVDAPSDVIAHYRFETIGPQIVDDTGVHHGSAVGPSLRTAVGHAGNSVEFPATSPAPHIVIPDSSDWDLQIGSIELWIRPRSGTAISGIFSRDSSGTSNGHIAMMQYRNQYFVIRLQTAGDAGGGGGLFLCSNAAPRPGIWTHIGINLGAPAAELWVDGVLATRTGPIDLFGMNQCTSPGTPRAIHGTDDPWVLGAQGVGSTPGTASNIGDPFVGGAIDELIIRRTRRIFM
jgi:hypothetical protein